MLKMNYQGCFSHSHEPEAEDSSIDSELRDIIKDYQHQALVLLAENPYVKPEEDGETEEVFSARGHELQEAIKQSQRHLADLDYEKQQFEKKLTQTAGAHRIKLLARIWQDRVEELVDLRAHVRNEYEDFNCEKYTVLIRDAMMSLEVLIRNSSHLSAEDYAILKINKREARARINAGGDEDADSDADEEILDDLPPDGSNATFESTFVAQSDEEGGDEEESNFMD